MLHLLSCLLGLDDFFSEMNLAEKDKLPYGFTSMWNLHTNNRLKKTGTKGMVTRREGVEGGNKGEGEVNNVMSQSQVVTRVSGVITL